jgi:nucleotide-binding universal stress UspA family protein
VARVDGQLEPRTRVVSVGAGAVAALLQVSRESGTPETGSEDGLVVVGRRGAGGFARMALGSTARRLVHDPEAPSVVVVPSAWELAEVPVQAPVVVDASPEGPDTVFGVDVHDTEPVSHGTPTSGTTATATIMTQAPLTSGRPSHGRQRALAAALARAQRDGRAVVAVSVWSAPADRADEGVPIAQVWAEAAAAAERDLDTVLAPWRTAYPEVHIMAVATDRHPVAALLDHAQDADLLVVPRGARACAIAEYATCPLNIT